MIYIEDLQNKIEISEDFIKRIENTIDFALKEESVTVDYEISMILVDNERIKGINSEHRNIDKETDVLSFPMLDYPKGKVYKDVYLNYDFDDTYFDENKLVLGDIVLSLEKAKSQSKEYGHSFERECFYLIIHSILHLLGYDHIEVQETKIMREREEYILNKLNIKR